MRKYQAQTYSIGNVAKMTGATKKQIRNWEASGHIPKADRVQCGDRAYRRFSLHQVELISKIRELHDEGYTLTKQNVWESITTPTGNDCSGNSPSSNSFSKMTDTTSTDPIKTKGSSPRRALFLSCSCPSLLQAKHTILFLARHQVRRAMHTILLKCRP
jgi:hypothetical protein